MHALFVNKGKLNFVGRSGTALDVRYSSHGSGEAPEKDTSGILAYFATESHPMGIQQQYFSYSRYIYI